jgi:hypothetical protein
MVAYDSFSLLLIQRCAVPPFSRLRSREEAHTQGQYTNSSTSAHPPATTTAVAIAGVTRNSEATHEIRVVPPNATLLSIRRKRAGAVPPVTSMLFHAQH